MFVKVLSSKGYENCSKNCGDCIIIDNGSELVIYDCGCEEHAKRVIEYMKQKGYDLVTVVLSHNDSDHFDGITYLLEEEKVSKIVTVLLLKYKDELLDKIDDGRKNRNSISEQIKDLYANIASLSKKVTLQNIYDNGKTISIAEGIEVVGPDEEYMLDAVAKGLDTREGDTIDGETIVNATSVQVQVAFDGKALLLTGDSSFEAIKDRLTEYQIIQLPHHGKKAQAEQIFDELFGKNEIVYIVSDNTGDSNGGSDKLDVKGHIVKNTKNDSNIELAETNINSYGRRSGSYGYKGVEYALSIRK
ncbi:MAG: MBL fold metallo-hydrolase [Oscillospiraceae bacterium]